MLDLYSVCAGEFIFTLKLNCSKWIVLPMEKIPTSLPFSTKFKAWVAAGLTYLLWSSPVLPYLHSMDSSEEPTQGWSHPLQHPASSTLSYSLKKAERGPLHVLKPRCHFSPCSGHMVALKDLPNFMWRRLHCPVWVPGWVFTYSVLSTSSGPVQV